VLKGSGKRLHPHFGGNETSSANVNIHRCMAQKLTQRDLFRSYRIAEAEVAVYLEDRLVKLN
jgi:hypothetical protein